MTEHSHRVGAPYRVTSPKAAEEFASNIQAALDQFGSAILDAFGIKDKDTPEQFSEVMTLKSKTALQGDAMKMLYTQVRELERQLGETRESLAKRSDALTKADARLSRVRYELRYDPRITAQSHLNRVRRVAGVGRYSS